MFRLRRTMILLSLLAAACGGGSGGDNNPDAMADLPDADRGSPDAAYDATTTNPDAVIANCIDVPTSCPQSPPVIGTPSGFGVESVDVQWNYCVDASGDGSITPFVYRTVPADIVSLAITVDHGSTKTGLGKVQLGSQVLIDFTSFGMGPFRHAPLTSAASTVVLPLDENSAPTGPNCLAVMAVAEGDLGGQTGQVHIVSRRGGNLGLIDLNFVIVNGTTISQAELSAAATIAADLYFNANAADIGNIQVYNTGVVGAFINTEGADVNTLRSTPFGADGRYMNVYFVEDFPDAPGTLGFAAGIPGPIGIHGTAGSGVVIGVASHRDGNGVIDTTTMGETIAHEIGHQIGLFHTTEADGMTHDFLSDTPQCTPASDTDMDGQLSATECQSLDGSHMMFWIAGIPQQQISPIQSDVIYFSPLTR